MRSGHIPGRFEEFCGRKSDYFVKLRVRRAGIGAAPGFQAGTADLRDASHSSKRCTTT